MRHRNGIVLLLGALAATITTVAAPPQGPGPTIVWVGGPEGRTIAVEVRGVVSADRLAPQGEAVFAVRVDRPGGAGSSMLGIYEAAGGVLRFIPRFPFDRGRRYVAEFHEGSTRVTSTHLVPSSEAAPAAVVRVDPGANVIPENLLKFYVHFATPMKRGEAYARTRLLDADGRPLDLPFLELGEELWDRSGTRLTLLLDPGRIKRGLVPREELGPILEQGRSYTFEIQAGWPSAAGNPLAEPYRRRIRVGPPDEIQPWPNDWTIEAPAAKSREPLVVRAHEPLDAALFATSLTVLDPNGAEVAGSVELRDDAKVWRFEPEVAWSGGDHVLVVADELEDLAGNSVRRPFEVDATRPVTSRPERGAVRRTIPIR